MSDSRSHNGGERWTRGAALAVLFGAASLALLVWMILPKKSVEQMAEEVEQKEAVASLCNRFTPGQCAKENAEARVAREKLENKLR